VAPPARTIAEQTFGRPPWFRQPAEVRQPRASALAGAISARERDQRAQVEAGAQTASSDSSETRMLSCSTDPVFALAAVHASAHALVLMLVFMHGIEASHDATPVSPQGTSSWPTIPPFASRQVITHVSWTVHSTDTWQSAGSEHAWESAHFVAVFGGVVFRP
jgi:hypothetical protein